MVISSSDLKSLLKKISPAKSEYTIITDGGLVASDSDLTICASSEAFKGAGLFQVNARKFSSVVNRMSGSIDFQKMENTLVLKSAKARVEIEIASVKPRQFFVPEILHTLPLDSVRDLLKYVSVAADSNKAAAQGGVVQLETVNDLIEDKAIALEAMGTDTKRCAYSTIPIELAGRFKYTIPLPAVAAISSISDSETVQIGEADSFYYLKSSQTTIYANRLNKVFPNYKQFLPKTFTFTAILDAKSMSSILHTVEPMVQDIEQNAVLLHFLDGRLNMKTVGSGGVAEDEMEYQADLLADVTEFKIKVNHKFLVDYFSNVSGEVSFNANEPKLIDGVLRAQPIILESGTRKMMIAPVAGGS